MGVMLSTLRGVLGRFFNFVPPLTGASISSSHHHHGGVLTLDENFVSRHKIKLELSLATAQETFKHSKKELSLDIASQIEAYVLSAGLHIGNILKEEASFQKVSELTKNLSDEAKAFIIDIHTHPEALTCLEKTHKELLNYTKGIREALQDTHPEQRHLHSQQRVSVYPLSRCLEEAIQELTQHLEMLPKGTKIHLQGLASPLRALQSTQLEYAKVCANVSALSSKLREYKSLSA